MLVFQLYRTLWALALTLSTSLAMALNGVGTRVAVVGGGPAGTLTALRIAQKWKDSKIDVYEQSTEKEFAKSAARSWNVVLFPRGLAALESAGIRPKEESPEEAVIVEGNVRHPKNGPGKLAGGFFKGAVSLERGALARLLLRRLITFPQVTVHFDHKLTDLDPSQSTVTFERGGAGNDGLESAEQTVAKTVTAVAAEFDLLVGADGVNSRVRQALEEKVDNFHVTEVLDTREFKTFKVPDAAKLEGGEDAWRRCFHVWRAPPGEILSPPCADGSLTAIVVVPADFEANFASTIKSPEDVRTFFAERYPLVFGAEGPGKEFCDDFFSARPGRQRTVYCNRLSHGRVALVGDAAHAMFASLGQGVNAALETSAILADVLLKQGDRGAGGNEGVAEALQRYDAIRRPDAHAVCRLSEQGMGGNSARSMSALALARMAAGLILNKIMPKVVPKPALLGISDPANSYADILRAMQKGSRRVGAFVTVGLAALAVRVAWPLARRLLRAAVAV